MRTLQVLGIVGILFGLAAGAGAAPLQNGDFSIPDLAGWTAYADGFTLDPANDPFSPVYDGGGYAVMTEDYTAWQLTLEQEFSLCPEIGPLSLSFDYRLTYPDDGTGPGAFPDAFTASLLDPVTMDPILYTPWSPTQTEFFYHDNAESDDPFLPSIDYDPTIVTWVGSFIQGHVTLDLTSLPAGTPVLLVFDLFLGDDGKQTTVEIDNVEVQCLPEPLTMVLVGVGLAGAVRYRARERRRGRG
jgi:hypothetical protein